MSAPSKPLRQPGLIVYLCGLGTSALALWLVQMANDNGENIMGWYANGILPVGAFLVGIASGVGYAVGSRVLQVKLSKAFVFGMLTTAVVDYFAAHYLTYLSLLEVHHIPAERYGFIDYFREISEGMSFKGKSSGEAGSPLGMWGYVYKLLEIGGYAGGAMVPSAMVFGMPYCKGCQQYLKGHRTGHLHSPEQWPVVKKLKKKERLAALQAAIKELIARANEFTTPIAAAPLAETEAAIATLDQTIHKDAAARITYTLKKCPSCDAHHLDLNLFNYTEDKKVSNSNVAKIDKTKVAEAMADAAAA
ncbi:MAG: hypothetical protein K9N47_23140 [Prosthecobacter sp.]|uniref:hypothetical protein n=1 Tax=Prosthecobacter sp. TaxID=1965333 RepID=UPI002632ACEC|nr:hypothetical protein [Prosthecobacter sp.]MCF7789039.1 hypothetical protein [Prosthecobacter sp.]